MKKLSLLAIALILAGCSALRGPPGPKQFDNVAVVISTDNAMLMPSPMDKDFLRIFRSRLNESTEKEIGTRGDLKVVGICGPRTLEITIDFVSINIDNETSASLLNPFKASATKVDVTRIAANISVKDCASGKVLQRVTKTSDSKSVYKVLADVGATSAAHAYKQQHSQL